ncbi:MAG: FAD-dependent monooxygenase, partial [Candidatus Dormibacteria bacterium]
MTGVDCAVAGGGPAGILVGLLLARRGVRVRVLEKHPDFLRDFRGDTIHPSTLEIMDDLGLTERLLRIEHHRETLLRFGFGSEVATIADLRRLPTRHRYVA